MKFSYSPLYIRWVHRKCSGGTAEIWRCLQGNDGCSNSGTQFGMSHTYILYCITCKFFVCVLFLSILQVATGSQE